MRLSGFTKLMVVLAGFGLVGVVGCAKPDSKPKAAAKDEGGSGAAVGGGVITPGKTEEASPTSETPTVDADKATEPTKEGDKPAEPAKEGDKPAEPAKEDAAKPAEPAKEGDKPAEPAKADEKPATEGDKK